MAETIDYNDSIIMDTFKSEVTDKLGGEVWGALTRDIGTPDMHTEGESGCTTMKELMERFDQTADRDTAKDILTHVRHGLKRSQFAWAKEKFAQYNNIDSFNQANREEQIQLFTKLRDTGEAFYGQPIDSEVLDFVVSQPGMLQAERRGAGLHITAFPHNMKEYVHETDERKKRYHACHCPFAKESILRENQEVSKTLCYCSLGHAKIMWEAIFDMELDGDVLASALNGDLLCKHVIYLPQEIMERYV